MPTPVYDTTAPVLVTGGTGYVAGWLIRRLLEEGFTVHATVRNPDDPAKVGHLTQMADALPGSLTLFKADLLEAGAFAPAMAGCRVVFHTASPFTLNIEDPQRDLVDPAVKGTRNVLETVNATPSVERVVLTSSCAAIYGDNIDVAGTTGGILTEDDWNTTSSIGHQAYSYSKVMAERAAWEMADAQSTWRLVVVNPSLVLGPGLAPTQTSESFNLLEQIAGGAFKSGVPHYEIGVVDVRTVAEAHMRAAFLPEAEGRHITSAKTMSFLDVADVIRRSHPDRPLPVRTLPKWLLWLLGPMVDKAVTRRFVARSVGHPWRADNSKSKQALGLEYHPVDTAIEEMVQQMVDTGRLKPA
ncbi:NAD-dependent epimerase/dehydratase family protein [Oceanibium sediminis]|uniref:NAD-dependent epimerase/dehydratase family protein n=1 Tax=Oceanibium sediminis TaxID=2026339 RepID=UPI000DD37D48|nr:NAD-dependent epimerase/dehydratase family protein [Oceanibium sediminis]